MPSDLSPAPPAAPDPAAPPPEAVAPDTAGRLALGFGVLTACLEAGDGLKQWLHLILPGNIIGLFLLLALLGMGAVPLRWVEPAARWLLWLLPLLFMPMFALKLNDRPFWFTQGRQVAGGVAVGTLLLWAFVGHLAQWLVRRPSQGGVTDAFSSND